MLYKSDFEKRLAKKGYTLKDAALITDEFLKTLEEILVEKESVSFYGFGVFDVRYHKEREAVALNTKEQILIPSFYSPHFTAGKRLKREVKEGVIRD